jgi:hypothetical protein
MMRAKLLCVISSILILLLVSACGEDSSPPSNTVVATVTLRPTHTPTAVETPVSPEPTDLTQEAGPLNLVAAENGGRVLSVTDELDCCPASNLLDGYTLDGGEWWTGEPPQVPQAIVFELADGRVWTIDHVVLNPWTSEWRFGWVKDFEIYVSDTSPELEQMGWVGSFRLWHYGIDQEFSFEPVQARYVALVVTSHWGGEEGITLNEFEVYPAPPGAVAVEPVRVSRIGNLVAADNGGSIVEYSSEDPSGNWSVDHLIDGEKDTATGWSSAEALDEVQFVTLSFPGEDTYVVNQVVLNPYSEKYEEDWIQDFELWGSDTTPELEALWQLGSYRLEQVGEDQAFTFEPVALRYITLVPKSNHGGTEYALNEFEVYEVGTAVSSELARTVTVPEDLGPLDDGLERPPESPPETTFIPSESGPRTVATSGDSPLDNIEYEINVYDLVPTIYHLYGSYFEDVVMARLTNHNPNAVKLRVEASVPNYTEVAVETVALEPGETIEIRQNPPLLPEALDMLHGRKNASLHVQIDYLKEGEQRLIYEGTQPLTVYSRDDFPWEIPGYYNGTIFLATMVTPNDPAMDGLLRAAADYHPDGQITFQYRDAYDSDHSVWQRMKAIYNAVSDQYDVTYVATGIPYAPREDEEEGFHLQRLKLPYEVLETRSGMCVELSTLFASAFEKILLRPIIVTVPGHVYVGLPISWNSETYYFLEATMVGQASFEEAVQYANQSFMDNALPYIEADRADLYFWLDVTEAREEGIWPIPWR